MAFSNSLIAWLMHRVVLVLLLILKRQKYYSSTLRQILLHLSSASKTASSPMWISLYTVLNSKLDLSPDIQGHACLASSAFGRLSQQVLLNRNLNLKTKMAVYKAVCVSKLLYGCEAWVLYCRHIKTLEQFHISCLQRMLRLHWWDKVLHVEIRHRAHCLSMWGHHCWTPAQMDRACHSNAGKPTATLCAIWQIKRGPKVYWWTVQTFLRLPEGNTEEKCYSSWPTGNISSGSQGLARHLYHWHPLHASNAG